MRCRKGILALCLRFFLLSCESSRGVDTALLPQGRIDSDELVLVLSLEPELLWRLR